MQKDKLLFGLLFFTGNAMAQQQTDFNRKGDEAMQRADYTDARMWYEEGVMSCNAYSIKQLTAIWTEHQQMRPSMRSLMNKCLNCLLVMANENDTTAMSQLIVYYSEGIGVPKNNELAGFWEDRLIRFRRTSESMLSETEFISHRKSNEPMKFFAGYTYSVESPFGILVGGVKSRLGWYGRFRSNFSHTDSRLECRGTKELIGTIPGNPPFHFTNRTRTTNYAAVAGLVVKCAPWLYTSVGLGYGNRQKFCEYVTLDATDSRIEQAYWAKNLDHSYNGLAAEVDFMVKFNRFFVGAGCNTLNFKYIDLNASAGLFF